MFDVFFAEDDGHNHTYTNTKSDRKDQTGDGQVHPNDRTGIGKRQDINCRRHEQEGDRRTQPGPFFVDPGEQGDHGAGANCQQEAGCGCSRVRDKFWRIAPQVAGDSLLGD